ncbi:MAG: hypothetical protein KAX18_13125 [Candidatus Lokiarchaeota archaeon]|nr:hypothetical protein [Candidatus Lokiarchaeota archaeon]
MTPSIISKVVELDNCNKDLLIKALYTAKFWETVNPAKKMEAKFVSPNVLYSKIIDEIVKIPVEMEGELVLQDQGEQEDGKGRLIEINVRNNKDIKELEGRLRIKELSTNRTKFGIFISSFKLNSDFINLIGKNVSELTLRNKITEMVRKLERWVKHNSLNDLLI